MNTEFAYKFYSTTKDAWDAMYQAILGAQKSIYWEIYIFVDDTAGARFLDILCEKVKSGVDVKIIFDSLGCMELSPAAVSRLQGCGVDVKWFNHLRPEINLGKWFNRLWCRNHRKVLIVDEETVFLGGVNVSVKFGDWYDVYLKMTGRVTRSLLRSFAKTYIRCGGDKNNVKKLLHPKLTAGLEEWKEKFNFITHSSARNKYSAVQKIYMQGIAMAKESFNLLTPYYVPDKKFLELVAAARARGVKVNIYLPFRPDYKVIEWIARAYFDLTHRAGAKIFLLKRMNHGKAMTTDGKSGFVGSANFTPRGFSINEEAGVFFNDEKMAGDLDDIFNSWEAESEPLDLERWRKRGVWSRFREWWAKKLSRFV